MHESAERGNDPAQFTRQVIAYFRNVLLMLMENPDRIDVPSEVFSEIEKHSRAIDIKNLLDLIRIFNGAINDRGGSWQPTLPLEMAFLDGLEVINKEGVNQGKSSKPQQKVKRTSPKPAQKTPPEQAPPQKEPLPSKTEKEGQQLTVLQQWRKILDGVREVNPVTQGILNSCKPLGIKDNKLVLSFQSDAIKEKIDGGDHIKVTEDAIEKVIGVRLPVLCIVGGKDQEDLPDGVDPDGLVAAVVRDLGGSYVSDQNEK